MANKKREREEEYFLTQEVARLKKLREEHQSKLKAAERKKMKEQHFMHCAKCGQKMETTTLAGVEIEVCPDCGGIYLDAGELGRIADQSQTGLLADTLALVRKLWGE